MSFSDKTQLNRPSSRVGGPRSPQCFAADENINELNLTLLGFPAPVRLSRTIAKNKNVMSSSSSPASNVSGKTESVADGAIKLLAKTAALNLGFVDGVDEYSTFNHPYFKMDGESSGQSSYVAAHNDDDESDSSCVSVFSSDENCTSKTVSCANSLTATPNCSPNERASRTAKVTTEEEGSYFSRSSSWTTNFESVRSECESASNRIDEYENEVSGEWNNFWRNYNDPKGFDPDKPFIQAAKDTDATTTERRGSQALQEKRLPQIQKVIMSTTDAIEAARCARRLSEILNSAIRRSSLPSTTKTINERDLVKLASLKCDDETGTDAAATPAPPPLPSSNIARSKSDSQIKKIAIKDIDLAIRKTQLKPVNIDCIEVEIVTTDPTDIAQLFQSVLTKRRDLIQPPDDVSTCQSQRSDWSVE